MNAPRRPRRRVDGVLVLDKPAATTSNGALQAVKRLYEAEKAGHTGTLDPFATGVLPICFGDATKFAQMLLDATKSYVAEVCFGVRTTTGDLDGDVLASVPVALTRADVEAALPRFRGHIAQVPPMHSALKRDGRPYYEYARRGIEIAREAREVEVFRLELVAWQSPRATLEVTCGKGTYVRTLAEDLGAVLGVGAHLTALRRTASGDFTLASAHALDAVADADARTRLDWLQPVEALLGALPAVDVDPATAAALRQGRSVPVPEMPPGRYRCRDEAGVLVGVVEAAEGRLVASRLCRTDAVPAVDRAAVPAEAG